MQQVMLFMDKNRRIALLSDALVVEKIALIGMLIENIKLLKSVLPAEKREKSIRIMEHIIDETLMHQRIFSKMLKKEAKK